jgi:rubrerythrin
MSEKEKATEAVAIALQTEKDGLEMYNRAAENASNPVAAKMFASLADDEKNHIAIIEAHVRQEGIGRLIDDAARQMPGKKIATIFSDSAGQVVERAKATEDDRKVIGVALEFERKGYEFYKKAAEAATDMVEKEMFEFLTGIENEHYAILQRTLDYLDRTGQWFLWDEKDLIEG